jgi:hypothetical protein
MVDRFDRDVDLGVAREHDAHDVGPALAHPRQELHARHARHALVGDDHAHRLAREHGERVVGGARGEHADRLAPEQARQRLQDVHLVVHEQDARVMQRFRCHAAPRYKTRAALA